MAKVGLIQYSATANSNSDVNGITISENAPFANMNNMGRQIMADMAQRFGSSVTVASAGTVALGDAEEQYVTISGTTTITSFGTPAVANQFGYWVMFSGALTLTHNGTSLILPGGANITTAAGDMAWCQHEGSGNWRLAYFKADGTPVGAVSNLAAAAISGRTEITAVDNAADFLLIWDATDSLLKKVKPQNVPGKVISYNYAEYTANSDLTTALPVDDTPPVITEGNQILSLAVTTTTSTQVVDIDILGIIAWTNATAMGMTVWRDTTCVFSSFIQPATATASAGNAPIGGRFRDSPAAAATYTYTVRVGSHAGGAGSCRMNGTVSGRLGNGTMKTTITAKVIEP